MKKITVFLQSTCTLELLPIRSGYEGVPKVRGHLADIFGKIPEEL